MKEDMYFVLREKYGDDWNIKEQCLKYLECDVKGLLEAMNKLNNRIYDNYNLLLSIGR